MKVLYIHSHYPNFSEAFIQNEVDHLIAQGAEVQILNLSWSNKASQSSIIRHNTVNLFKFRLGRSLIRSRDLKGESFAARIIKQVYMQLTSSYLVKAANTFSPDIIVSHFAFSTSKIASELAKSIDVKHYLRLHTRYTTLSDEALQSVLSKANGGSAISESVIRHYQSYSGLRLNLIRQDINIPELHYSHSSPSNVLKLMAIGRFIEKKGFESMISAVSLLIKEQGIDVQLRLIGEGKLARKYSLLIEKENLAETVFLEGPKPHRELMSTLKNADLLLVPSIDNGTDEEGIPTVIPEAMSVGTPVLCSLVGGLSEIIKAGENAYVLKDTSPTGISSSLVKVLDKKSEWKYVCEQARKDVEEHYKKRLSIADLRIE